MGLFKGKKGIVATPRAVQGKEVIRKRGTPIRATVTDVICKRNGFIVMAVYEDRWLGSQRIYASDLLQQQPCVHIGGEVVVYVDDVDSDGKYFLDC